MRIAYEYLAGMSAVAQKTKTNVYNKWWLYWPHETLSTGYTQNPLCRFIMSHLAFMNWIIGLQRNTDFCLILQCKKTRFIYS